MKIASVKLCYNAEINEFIDVTSFPLKNLRLKKIKTHIFGAMNLSI